MDIREELARIQLELNAPKGQYNDFSKYLYRSCEDILSAVKPLLNGMTVTISDEMIILGDRFYVKATVTLRGKSDGGISVDGWAREAQNKKGMDEAQITGAASSYARKYALNGLFAIDDTKDPDGMDNSHNPKSAPQINLSAIAKECGYADQEVCNTFNPPLTTINDVQDKEACANWLRGNKK